MTTTSAAPPAPAEATGLLHRYAAIRADPMRRIATLAAAISAVQLLIRGWLGFRGYFYLDDFAFTGRAAQFGLSPSKFLTVAYNSHLMPGALVEVWAATTAWPLQYWPVVAVALMQQALLDVLFYRLLRELFGPRPGILIPFAVFAMSPISLPAFLWWAAALNQLPQQLAMVGALLLHVQYLRTGSRRRAIAAVLVVGGGLLFSEKSLLAVVLVVAFTFLFAAQGAPVHRARALWREHRPVWLSYAVLCVPYVGYYLLAVPSPARAGASGASIASLAGDALRDAIVPGLLGGPWTWRPIGFAGALAAPGRLAIGASALIATALVLAVAVWFRRAVFGLALAGIFIVLDIALLAASRAPVIGAEIGDEYRYLTEIALVAALGLALATMPIRGDFTRGRVQRLTVRESSARTVHSFALHEQAGLIWRPSAAVAVALAVLALMLSSSITSVRYDPYWHPNPARPYLRTLTNELQATGWAITVYDQPVPPQVAWGVLYPYSKVSRMLAPLRREPAYLRAEVPSDTLAVVDDAGHLRRVSIQGGHNVPGPRPSCGWYVHQNIVSIPLAAKTLDGTWVLRIGYIASADTEITLSAGRTSALASLHKGLNAVYLQVQGVIDQVAVGSPSDTASICTDDVAVGLPVAVPGSAFSIR